MLRRKSHILILIGFILFVMIVLPLIVILFYGYYITGGEYLISKSSSDWADFGTLLSGVFTLSGALATLSTLIFLIFESKRNNAERSEQVEREKEIASINNDKIIFEKYKLHREMFDDILNKIESDFDNEFIITNRSTLYGKIFPANTFSHCETKIELNEKARVNDLVDMLSWCDRVSENFRSDEYSATPTKFVYDITNICTSIGLKYKRNSRHGDIITLGGVVIDAYNPEKIILVVTRVINEFILFSQNEKRLDILYLLNQSKLMILTYKSGMEFNLIKKRDKSFPFNFLIESNDIYKAFEFAYALESTPIEIKPHLSRTINFIDNFFSIKQDVINLSIYGCFASFIDDYIYNLKSDLTLAQESNISKTVINAIKSHITAAERQKIIFNS
ncbi:hypothetical protein ACT0OT_004146 [Yersinia enterocolitica]